MVFTLQNLLSPGKGMNAVNIPMQTCSSLFLARAQSIRQVVDPARARTDVQNENDGHWFSCALIIPRTHKFLEPSSFPSPFLSTIEDCRYFQGLLEFRVSSADFIETDMEKSCPDCGKVAWIKARSNLNSGEGVVIDHPVTAAKRFEGSVQLFVYFWIRPTKQQSIHIKMSSETRHLCHHRLKAIHPLACMHNTGCQCVYGEWRKDRNWWKMLRVVCVGTFSFSLPHVSSISSGILKCDFSQNCNWFSVRSQEGVTI